MAAQTQKATQVRIFGMHCASCALRVEKALGGLRGVSYVSVDFASAMATLSYDAAAVTLARIGATIDGLGYRYVGELTGDSLSEEDRVRKLTLRRDRDRAIAGIVGGALLMALMYLPLHGFHAVMGYVMLAVSLPLLLFTALPIFMAAGHALRAFDLTMDVMYALGIGVALLSSVIATFGILLPRTFMLYDSAVMLAGFLMLGRFLESRARGRTSEALRRLLQLRPTVARLVKDGEEQEVPLEAVRPADLLRVRGGDRVPVDGRVTDGGGSIDESMMTGEPVPVERAAGDAVIGGTVCTNGSLTMRAERVGSDTALARVIRLVQEASSARPAIQRFADRVVRVFIPVILLVAVGAALLWLLAAHASLTFAVTVFVAVVVVACPCALGLATPAAITVGVGRGAALGILVRSPDVLERADRITVALFDKTGTLTKGKPAVTGVVAVDGDEAGLLRLAASVEQRVNHPLAAAVAAEARSRGLDLWEPSDVKTSGGLGVAAIVEGWRVVVGNGACLRREGIDEDAAQASEAQKRGETVVLVAVDGRYAGCVTLADSVREGAAAAVAALKRRGVRTVMVTGDGEGAARRVAAQVGIDEVASRVLPEGKAEEVARRQAAGGSVLFVGDGVNDAPALASADVGIAMGRGTDVAVKAGHVVLTRDDPRDVVAAIELGRAVMRRVRQNVFWAFAYNAVLVPAAAGVLYPFTGLVFQPEWGALAMAFSSVTVVTLALQLRRFVPESRRRS